jgi:myb proto-oncogene protein
VPRRVWKKEEDAKLIEAVEQHVRVWVTVAAMVPGRTNVQCRKRWLDTLDPANGKKLGEWTQAEDAKLTEAVQDLGKHSWGAAAALVPGRTNIQCRARWVHTLDPTNGKNLGKWTQAEDAKLAEAVQNLGKHSWVAVAAMVPGRTNIQCRARWVHTLGPDGASNAV